MVDNILRPFIIGGRSQLPLLIVFFSVLGGMLVLGPVGLVLGPVLLTTTLVLLDILRLKLAEPTSALDRDLEEPPSPLRSLREDEEVKR
jgi:predicted PurR-regulated permease PerM